MALLLPTITAKRCACACIPCHVACVGKVGVIFLCDLEFNAKSVREVGDLPPERKRGALMPQAAQLAASHEYGFFYIY